MSKKLIFVILILISFLSASHLYAAAKKSLLEGDLLSVSFPTEMEGWVCGREGSILHTTDGGSTWDRQKSGTDYTLSSIFFKDTKTGWAVGNGGTILHTVDGGAHWAKQNSPVKFYLMDVYFADSKTGWIVTQKTHILYTENGGSTWNVQFRDKKAEYTLKRISFCDAKTGWAVGEYGFTYGTNNGGKTWQKLGGKFSVNVYGDIDAGIFLFDVLAIDPKTAWVVGIDGYVAKTVDGGKTWNRVSAKFPNTHFFNIAGDRRDLLVIAGRGVIYESYDGGKSFSPGHANPQVTYGWFYGLDARGEKGFVVAGQKGTIYRGNFSKEKKLSWEEVKW